MWEFGRNSKSLGNTLPTGSYTSKLCVKNIEKETNIHYFTIIVKFRSISSHFRGLNFKISPGECMHTEPHHSQKCCAVPDCSLKSTVTWLPRSNNIANDKGGEESLQYTLTQVDYIQRIVSLVCSFGLILKFILLFF